MSTDTKRRLEVAGLIVSILVAITSALAAWVVLPYRMEAAEVEIRQLKSERALDHDLLNRIAVTQERMEKTLDRMVK
jgi:hypothetical protein